MTSILEPIPVSAATFPLFVGVDVGGTNIKVGIVDDQGRTIGRTSIRSESHDGPDAAMARVGEALEQLLKQLGVSSDQVAAIGLGSPGMMDIPRGLLLHPVNLPGWDNIRVKDFFESRTVIKTYLQNDANACAVAEWKFGAGVGKESLAFLTFGTGLGAGLILNGALYSGHTDTAGEIGHVRLTADGPVGFGKSGSVEGYCSGGGIAQLARSAVKQRLDRGESPLLLERAGSLEDIDARITAELAKEGDELCLSVYRKSGEMLGVSLSILMDILNPQLIIIGSIYARDTELLRPAMLEVIEREALSPCPVVPSGLGEQIGDYAALSVAAGDFYGR